MGKPKRPDTAVEQVHSEPFFEVLEILAGGRLADAVLGCAAADTAVLGDVAEDLKVGDRHNSGDP
jgi:hypothetical protein